MNLNCRLLLAWPKAMRGSCEARLASTASALRVGWLCGSFFCLQRASAFANELNQASHRVPGNGSGPGGATPGPAPVPLALL